MSAGGLLTYTLDLTNLAPPMPKTCPSPTLPHPLSAHLSGQGHLAAWTGSLALGTLPAGDHRQILLRGTVAQGPAAPDQYRYRRQRHPDPRPENNESTALTPVDTAADLALTKSGAPNPVLHGRLVYTRA
ncbi:MAG: hypothetical protein ACLS43_02035 [Evtepia gabavorous]